MIVFMFHHHSGSSFSLYICFYYKSYLINTRCIFIWQSQSLYKLGVYILIIQVQLMIILKLRKIKQLAQNIQPSRIRICSVTHLCPTLCDPMGCSTAGFPVLHQLLELAQTHVHQASNAIQLSHLLSSPAPAFNLSQHQDHFQ